MKKPSKARSKTAGRAAQARAPSRAPSGATSARGATRQRASKPVAAPAALPPSSRPQPPAAEGLLAPLFTRDDRTLVALLLLPVVILTLAVGAVQSLAPSDSARRQLALLPAATAVSAIAPAAAVRAEAVALAGTLSPVRERPKPVASIAAAPVQTIAVHGNAGLIPADTQLRELPPADAVVAKIASLGHPDKCVAPAGKLAPASAAVAPTPEAFGRMLAFAARTQTEDLIVYTDQYRDMGFPMGDVRPLYGVCTDVVVRAYRALGIDLQVLVHNAKLGTGDPSIDHRRVETLRRFFAKYGTSIPVTSFVEEFQPGDIVTYRRPEGRGSQTHIAIVSDVMAQSGRPMVVHNRGWGPQLEDALFANGMTGHFRFWKTGPAEPTVPHPAPPPAAQTPWPDAARVRVDTADAR